MNNDDGDSSRQNSSSSAIGALLVALPLLYAFSMGPVAFLVEKYHVMSSMGAPVRTFYMPMIWLHEHTSLKQPLESYVKWWENLARGSP